MAIDYTKLIWVNNVTPVNAYNMNHIEEGIYAITAYVNSLGDSYPGIFDVIQGQIEELQRDIEHYEAGNGLLLNNHTFTIDAGVVATIDYVNQSIETLKRNSFQDVDTNTYPTLEDFLESTGEEGYIYLYPIDISDITKGYHQYIWESNSWRYIGDTALNLTNYPQKSQAETITGAWNFTGDLTSSGNNTWNGSNKFMIGVTTNSIGSGNGLNGIVQFKCNDTTIFKMNLSGLYPAGNNYYSLGSNVDKWKDLYLAGLLKDGTNSVSVADISKGIFNVINASDIVDNTLTDEQYALITNGKPTLIKGNYGNRYNIWIEVGTIYGTYYDCECRFTNQYGAHYRTAIRIPTTSPYTFSLNNFGIYFNYQGANAELPSLKSVNGKDIPTYPTLSTGDIEKVLTYKDNNTMAWENGSGCIEIPAPASTTLTDDLIALFTSGKIVKVKGDFLGYHNPVFFPTKRRDDREYGLVFGINDSYAEGGIWGYSILVTSKQISPHKKLITQSLTYGVNNYYLFAKSFPTYPSDTTKPYKLTQQVGGNLAWATELYGETVADNTITELPYEKIAQITIGLNTTFTLKAPQTNCIPEYKALITNGVSAPITIVLTGVSKAQTNDDNIEITEGTNTSIVLPASTSVEVNIFNGHAIIYNWEAED